MANGFWRLGAVAAFAFALTSVSAHADDGFFTFTSALSPPNNGYCIDVPNADFQPGKPVSLFGCARTPNQTFQLANGSNLTAGGLCLDGLSSNRGQPPGAGDNVVLAECDGSDHQVWELEPFTSNTSLFSIVDPAGLCVTVDGASAAPRTPLVLAQCAEMQSQGWIQGGVPRPVPVRAQGGSTYVGGYGQYEEPEYYWYTGHRYCWYDGGWHGGGWYWCGENFHNGIGWGGPIGWHFWFHFGHKWFPHPVLFAAHHGIMPHKHDVAAVAKNFGGNQGGNGNQGGKGNRGGKGNQGGQIGQGGQGAGGQAGGGKVDAGKGDTVKRHDVSKRDTGKSSQIGSATSGAGSGKISTGGSSGKNISSGGGKSGSGAGGGGGGGNKVVRAVGSSSGKEKKKP